MHLHPFPALTQTTHNPPCKTDLEKMTAGSPRSCRNRGWCRRRRRRSSPCSRRSPDRRLPSWHRMLPRRSRSSPARWHGWPAGRFRRPDGEARFAPVERKPHVLIKENIQLMNEGGNPFDESRENSVGRSVWKPTSVSRISGWRINDKTPLVCQGRHQVGGSMGGKTLVYKEGTTNRWINGKVHFCIKENIQQVDQWSVLPEYKKEHPVGKSMGRPIWWAKKEALRSTYRRKQRRGTIRRKNQGYHSFGKDKAYKDKTHLEGSSIRG